MLKQKFIVHFGSNFIIQLFSLFAGIIVARLAGPEVVGTIAYGTSYVMVWGFLTGLFGSGHIKLVSEGQNIGKCMAVYSRLLIGSVALYFFVVSGFFLIQKYVLHLKFENDAQQLVIFLLFFAAVFENFYNFSSTTFTATMEQARANLPFFVKSIAWQTGRIVVVLLGFKAIGLAAWNLVIALLVLPLVYKLIKKYPGTEWDHELFKRYVGYAVPIFFVVVINSIIQYSDKLFLAHYTNTIELGYFSAANSIGGLVLIAATAVGNIFFPLFSSLLRTNDWDAVRGKIMQYQEFLAIFAFPLVCIIAVISAPLLVFVLGDRYEPSIVPFVIIAFATYVSVAGMPYGNTITGAGRFYLNVLINLIKLVIFVISINILISPRFLGLGATGLALNLLVINLATNLLYLHFSKSLNNLSFFSIQNAFRYLMIFSVSVALYLYQDTFSEWFAFWWIAIVPVYLIFVYGLMYIMGLVKITHARQLMDLINVTKVLAYVKGELGDNNE